MRDATLWKQIDAWANRHWPALSVAGYLLALAIAFGGVALAACESGSGLMSAALCGALAIAFFRFYARSIPAVQRLIDTLHPPAPNKLAKPDEIPNWAVAIYVLIGYALAFTIIHLETGTRVALEVFVAWVAGQSLLDLFWRKRDGSTRFGIAFDAFDTWLDEKAAPHWPLLMRLRTVAGCAALFGGVAVYAWQTGVDRVAQALCGPACLATPGFASMADVACGAAAILFVMLYTRLTLAAQRVLLDPFKFVRPEPKPEAAATWAVAIHVILGFVVLFVMGGVGQMEIPHMVRVSSESPEGAGLLLGWWIGGLIVLRFFWAKWRRGERFVHRGAGVADER